MVARTTEFLDIAFRPRWPAWHAQFDRELTVSNVSALVRIYYDTVTLGRFQDDQRTGQPADGIAPQYHPALPLSAASTCTATTATCCGRTSSGQLYGVSRTAEVRGNRAAGPGLGLVLALPVGLVLALGLVMIARATEAASFTGTGSARHRGHRAKKPGKAASTRRDGPAPWIAPAILEALACRIRLCYQCFLPA